jgi:hypothetical protein
MGPTPTPELCPAKANVDVSQIDADSHAEAILSFQPKIIVVLLFADCSLFLLRLLTSTGAIVSMWFTLMLPLLGNELLCVHVHLKRKGVFLSVASCLEVSPPIRPDSIPYPLSIVRVPSLGRRPRLQCPDRRRCRCTIRLDLLQLNQRSNTNPSVDGPYNQSTSGSSIAPLHYHHVLNMPSLVSRQSNSG